MKLIKLFSVCLLLVVMASLPVNVFSQIKPVQIFTVGFGYSTCLTQSDGLDSFKESFNWVYLDALSNPMKGIGPAIGPRWTLGYRWLDKTSKALSIGYQTFSGNDVGNFGNGETRNITLRIKGLFIEGEYGKMFKNMFVNGAATIYFRRDVELESSYAPERQNDKQALDGTYEGITAVSADLGLVFGLYKDPVVISIRIMYPVLTGGGSTNLKDNSPDKIANETFIFPDDYYSYLFGGSYKGVKSNIDGLKITMTMGIVVPIQDLLKKVF